MTSLKLLPNSFTKRKSIFFLQMDDFASLVRPIRRRLEKRRRSVRICPPPSLPPFSSCPKRVKATLLFPPLPSFLHRYSFHRPLSLRLPSHFPNHEKKPTEGGGRGGSGRRRGRQPLWGRKKKTGGGGGAMGAGSHKGGRRGREGGLGGPEANAQGRRKRSRLNVVQHSTSRCYKFTPPPLFRALLV